MTNSDQNYLAETQAFTPWLYVLMIGLLALSAFGVWSTQGRKPILLTSLVSVVPLMNLLCLRTRVTKRELVVTFGALFPLYRRRIRLDAIISADAVTYHPIPDYGGWGIRGTGSNVALSARGNRGVRLTLRDGRVVLVGSQNPEALTAALIARY